MGGLQRVVASVHFAGLLTTSYVQAQSKFILNQLKNNFSLDHPQWQRPQEVDERFIASITDRKSHISIDAITLELYEKGFRISTVNNMFNFEWYQPNDSTVVELVSQKKKFMKILSKNSTFDYQSEFISQKRHGEWFLVDYVPIKGEKNVEKDSLDKLTPLPYGKGVEPASSMYERFKTGQLRETEDFFILGLTYAARTHDTTPSFTGENGELSGKIGLDISSIPVSKDDMYYVGENVLIEYALPNCSVADSSATREIKSFKTDIIIVKPKIIGGFYDALGEKK